MSEKVERISKEEYDKILGEIREARKRERQDQPPAKAKQTNDGQLTVAKEAMEIGLQVWRLRKEGYNFYEIHKRLELPLSVIHQACREFECRMSMDTARALEHYRTLDDARIESLLKCWLPIATGGPIEVQKVRDGQTYTELDCDLPLK